MSEEHVVHRDDAEPMLPGRTIHPEGNWPQSEFEQRREGEIEADEYDAAREWLRHVEAGGLAE